MIVPAVVRLRHAVRGAAKSTGKALAKYGPPVVAGSALGATGLAVATDPKPIESTLRTDRETAERLAQDLPISEDVAPFVRWQEVSRPPSVMQEYPESVSMYDQLKGVLTALSEIRKSNRG